MPRILMAGVGAHGHTNLPLPVIAELVDRGHHVSWSIPAPFAETVAATGATPIVVESVVPDEARGGQWPADPVAGTSMFLDDAIHVFPQIERALGADPPDLVLYDIGGYPGRALAEQHGIPLVQLSPSVVAWEGFEHDMAEALAFRATPEYAGYQQRFAAWLATLGIDMTPDHSGRKSSRNLVTCSMTMAGLPFTIPRISNRRAATLPLGTWPAAMSKASGAGSCSTLSEMSSISMPSPAANCRMEVPQAMLSTPG